MVIICLNIYDLTDMSNFLIEAKHPIDKDIRLACMLDNYFGHYQYGIRFVQKDNPNKWEKRVYKAHEINLDENINKIELDNEEMEVLKIRETKLDRLIRAIYGN